MSDMALLRIGILVAGVILIATIIFFGRPKKPNQGKRIEPGERDGSRVEPSLADSFNSDGSVADYSSDAVSQPELGLPGTHAAADSDLGKRPDHTHVVIQEIALEDWGFAGLLTDEWRKQQPPA